MHIVYGYDEHSLLRWKYATTTSTERAINKHISLSQKRIEQN